MDDTEVACIADGQSLLAYALPGLAICGAFFSDGGGERFRYLSAVSCADALDRNSRDLRRNHRMRRSATRERQDCGRFRSPASIGKQIAANPYRSCAQLG